MTSTNSPSEANLRDQLVAVIDLLGLHSPQVEYPLPNASGTRGRIDILARDAHQRYVVVEIKVSGKRSREALHEVSKYMGLLTREKDVNPDRVRALIVSTEWNELLVSFSEESRRFGERLAGYQLICDESGTLVDAEPVIPLPEKHAWGLNYAQALFRFRSREAREAGRIAVTKRAHSIGIRDFVVLFLDHNQGFSDYMTRPYMLYLALNEPDSRDEDAAVFRRQTFGPSEPHPDILTEWEAHYGTPADELRAHVLLWLLSTPFADRVAMEPASRDMFARLMHVTADWTLIQVHPAGTFRSRLGDATIEDRDEGIIQEIAGWNVRNPLHFVGSLVPHDAASWDAYRHRIGDAVRDNEEWRNVVPTWLASVGRRFPGSNVEASLLPGNDLLYALVKGWPLDFDRFLPWLYITVINGETQCTRIVSDSAWSGDVLPDLIERVRDIYPTPWDWWKRRKSGTVTEANAALLASWGLSWPLNEELLTTQRLSVERVGGMKPGHRLVRSSLPDISTKQEIFRFVGARAGQITDLVNEYRTTLTSVLSLPISPLFPDHT